MAARVCLEPGCPVLTVTTRCPAHTRKRDAARGRRQERGYDAEHDAARAAWLPAVEAGTVTCRRASNGTCLEPNPVIAPGQPWQLGHPDAGCSAPRAPEHRRCNTATALPHRR